MMPRRLVPSPPPAPNHPPTHFVAARTKGLQIHAGLQPTHLLNIHSIDTPEGYLEMDATLASIRNGRAQWRLAFEPIAGPLERTIAKQKEALAEAKKAAEGAKQLDGEISGKFDELEAHAKRLMAEYKANEQRLIEETRAAQDREAARLREEARKREVQAAAARTPQLKARLEQQRADLVAQAEDVEEAVETVIQPVKGASSTSRTKQVARIADPLKFLRAVTHYTPTAGVYAMGKPPLMVTDRKGEPAPLVDIVNARLQELYREQPGVVASWPGVVIEDEVTIANR